MHIKTLILYTLIIPLSCNNNIDHTASLNNKFKEAPRYGDDNTNTYKTISKIPLPPGFSRIERAADSFAGWLGLIKLKKNKTVYQFNGIPKPNQAAQFAVLDISVGPRDLQQCADAVMRLRAEYLFAIKKFGAIQFIDKNGIVYQFLAPYTYNRLLQYLDRVFARCGSASLAKQLSNSSFKDIEPGNVIIRGGFPGHAVIVMDVAMNKEGKKIYLLAQSYMPAQDIHLLVNPMNKLLSPWYEANEDEVIETPEYRFKKRELKKW